MRHLVMAGGVALNVVSTGMLSREGPFDEIWIQPAAGDAGSALGAALWLWHMVLGNARETEQPDAMQGSLLGPDIPETGADDDEELRSLGGVWETLSDHDLQVRIAALIAEGRVVAVARGRMEWGPRALGARSILGDARSPKMQSHMNLKIKFRESFRPFAPMVLADRAQDWFDVTQESPYMLLAYPVSGRRRRAPVGDEANLWGIDLLKVPRSEVPAVTHVDYSARVQTIDPVRSPFIHGVLSEFERLTGVPVIINTSFNVRGEPIVCTARDAYRCFVATEIDCLVVGNRLLLREHQQSCTMDEEQRQRWLANFALD
jgi:carbamoyltransferase